MSNDSSRVADRLARFSLALASVVVLILARPTPQSCACTTPPGGHPVYTVAERTDAADVVLEGTVTAVTDVFYGTATVSVHRYFKGKGPAIVTVSELGTTAMCLSPVWVSDRRIFYTAGDPSLGLRAHYMGASDSVDPVHTEIIAEIIATVGHDPIPPFGYYVYLPTILK